jgi:hypothetical protein
VLSASRLPSPLLESRTMYPLETPRVVYYRKSAEIYIAAVLNIYRCNVTCGSNWYISIAARGYVDQVWCIRYKGPSRYYCNVTLYTGKATVQHGYGLDNEVVIYAKL